VTVPSNGKEQIVFEIGKTSECGKRAADVCRGAKT